MVAKKNQAGLQKCTDSKVKINRLLKRDRITEADTDRLSEDEKKQFNEIVDEKMRKAGPTERDEILNKIEQILTDDTKNDFWEYNHSRIMIAIESLMLEYGRMPSRAEIAQKADLSRTTVYKHLTGYMNNPLYLEQLQKLRIMATNVLAKVYYSALAGDIGSQKLYLNCTGFLNNGQGTQIQNQNNYIQINGMILSQETIKRLNPEQLNNIETILKAALPQLEILNTEIAKK